MDPSIRIKLVGDGFDRGKAQPEMLPHIGRGARVPCDQEMRLGDPDTDTRLHIV